MFTATPSLQSIVSRAPSGYEAFASPVKAMYNPFTKISTCADGALPGLTVYRCSLEHAKAPVDVLAAIIDLPTTTYALHICACLRLQVPDSCPYDSNGLRSKGA